MATATLNDFPVTDDWTELTATITGAVDVNAAIQNVGESPVLVVHGGASAPSSKSGLYLAPADSMQGNASNIWVKCPNLGESSSVSTTTV